VLMRCEGEMIQLVLFTRPEDQQAMRLSCWDQVAVLSRG